MQLEEILSEIKHFCRTNADPVTARKYARFFAEGYDAYGLSRELMEKQRDFWLRNYKAELGFQGFLKLSELLLKSGKYEEASYAIWFTAAFKDDYTPRTFDGIGQWLEKDFRNWAHTDVLCGHVLSHFIINKIVPIKALAEWRTSGSKWKRRAVPVTLIESLKTDIAVSYLLDFISPMMPDEEKVVHQGLGWFLREAWKKHPTVVEKFLLRWKDSCSRLIIRYATEKMSANDKIKFKKVKAR